MILPGYSELPSTFKSVCPYLVAAFTFHDDFLRSELTPTHPIFSSQLYVTGVLSRLKQHVLSGSGRCRVTGICATGIPQFMAVGMEIADLRREVEALAAGIEKVKTDLLASIDTLPEKLETRLLDNFSIDGTQVTRRDLDQISTHISACIASLRAELAGAHALPASTGSSVDTPSVSVPTLPFKTWNWGGAFHPVPEGWKLPRPSFKAFFFLWHRGDPSAGIQPLKNLSRRDVTSTDWTQASRCRSLIHHLDGLKACDVDVSSLSAVELGRYFDERYDILLSQLYSSRGGREGEKGIGTLYNRLMDSRKK